MPTCPTCDAVYGAGQRFCPHDGAALAATDEIETALDTDNLIGRVLDKKYKLEEKIGAGGMGSVYRGRHLLMDRKVAIKVVRHEVAADDTTIKRFHREAKHSCRLDHQNCVRVTDFGDDGGLLYLVMEYLDGKTVGEEIYYDGPMLPRRVAHIGAQAARALQHAHDLAIVHRDLKPDNIMLLRRDDDPDSVKVLDFGLAKLLERDDVEPALTNPSFGSLTEAGIVFGTPEYMSPEQAAGNPLDTRTDLYSLGVVMYQMVTGQLPFTGDTFMAILTKHVTEPPIPPSARRPDLAIPLSLDRAILRCMEKEPDDRPATAAELAELLDAVVAELPTADARVPRTVAAAATIDLTAAVADAGLPTLRGPAVTVQGPITAEVTDPIARGRPPHKRGAGTWIAAVALVAAAAAGAVALVARGGSDGEAAGPGAAPPPAATDAAVAAVSAAAPADATPVAAAAVDAGAASDAGLDRAAKPPRPPRPAADPRIADHLQRAEAARRSKRWLKVIAEADQVLRIAPGHRRASFLMGEAQLESGDKPNGCKYLRKAGRRWGAHRLYKRAQCGD